MTTYQVDRRGLVYPLSTRSDEISKADHPDVEAGRARVRWELDMYIETMTDAERAE